MVLKQLWLLGSGSRQDEVGRSCKVDRQGTLGSLDMLGTGIFARQDVQSRSGTERIPEEPAGVSKS